MVGAESRHCIGRTHHRLDGLLLLVCKNVNSLTGWKLCGDELDGDRCLLWLLLLVLLWVDDADVVKVRGWLLQCNWLRLRHCELLHAVTSASSVVVAVQVVGQVTHNL